MKYPFELPGYPSPPRDALVANIAEARARGDQRLVQLGESALRRHDALAARKATEPSGVRVNPTLVGVAPPAVRSAPTPSAIVPPHPTTYSFVDPSRRSA